jgi:hypothetical protein
MRHTVVVCNPGLEYLTASHLRLAWICNDIDKGDTIKPNHLLKIDVTSLIAVGVLQRQAEIGAIGI